MEIVFITLFPEVVLNTARYSILKRAEDAKIIKFSAINPREFAIDNHRTVDDTPYGGGPGMVMKPDVLASAIDNCLRNKSHPAVIFPTPSGSLFTAQTAKELTQFDSLCLVCGHYEGVDERVVKHYATHEISIGDYILTGGELPSLVIVDAVVRLMPGVLGDAESLAIDSFSDGLLGHPQYTRPFQWLDYSVPDVLVSGNHKAIERWRRKQRLKITRERRPDLLAKAQLTREDLELLPESD